MAMGEFGGQARAVLWRMKANLSSAGHSLSFSEMFKTLRYYWIVARGYRLKPWKSPYLQWRLETFLGPEAAQLTPKKFFHLLWKYRAQMDRFVDWAAERRRAQRRRFS